MFLPGSYSIWHIVVQFGLISLMLVIGNIIRRNVKFLRNMLFPTAIIGGFIGLGLKYLIIWLDLRIDGYLILDQTFLDAITYHALAIGFVAMGLKSVKKANNKIKGKPVKSGLLIVNTYLLQGIIGLLVTFVLSLIFANVGGLKIAGLLLPMGYGQGPGQAGNIGTQFETNAFEPLIGGRAFGLSVAMFGILWSCVAGIIYINRRAKEGKVKKAGEELGVSVSSQEIETKDEIPVSDAIDKLSVQIIFVAVVYLIAFFIMKGITTALSALNLDNFTNLIWGFNFIFAMLIAILFKVILNGLTKAKIMKRKYTNEYMLDRIAGAVFDFMIVASIMAIDIKVIFENTGLLISLFVLTTIGGFVTYFYLKFLIKRIYPKYEHEAFAIMWGNLAGTASNGVALLREIDPKFESPAMDDLVTGSSTAVLFGAPLLIITGVIYQGTWWYWGSIAIMIVFFILYSIFLTTNFSNRVKHHNKNKTIDLKGGKNE